jgi:hypothetical protein
LRVGALVAAESDIRALVERAALPHEAIEILDAARPDASVTPDEVGGLLSAVGRIIAAVGRNEPRLGV